MKLFHLIAWLQEPGRMMAFYDLLTACRWIYQSGRPTEDPVLNSFSGLHRG